MLKEALEKERPFTNKVELVRFVKFEEDTSTENEVDLAEPKVIGDIYKAPVFELDTLTL